MKHDFSKGTSLALIAGMYVLALCIGVGAFAWAVEAKIISGVGVSGGKTELQPQGTATRAQAAAIIQRFDQWRLK